MRTEWMQKATFSEICRCLKKRDTMIHDCISGIIDLAFLIFPALPCKELNAFSDSILLTDIKAVASGAIRGITSILPKKDDDFVTRYNNVRIAHILLVFAAYFDSIKMYLPDENRAISLSPTEKVYLSDKAIANYTHACKEGFTHTQEQKGRIITDWELDIPNPVEGMTRAKNQLNEFYSYLNKHFLDFLLGLGIYEQMNGTQRDKLHAYLNTLPNLAVNNYEAQYYSLAAECPDFFVWSTINDHKQIDIGFKQLSEKIASFTEHISQLQAIRALDECDREYRSYVKKPVISQDKIRTDSQAVFLPSRESCFVPQDFKVLIYRERGLIENAQQWTTAAWTIGKFLTHTLRSPELGEKPLLILGHPGSGKTLLSHMLAAKLLHHEYHTILIKLREIPAEKNIHEQINVQLRNNGIDYCSWSDIIHGNLSKPMLLIFDGYDELLQATGKSHADYINRIADFQQRQRDIFGIAPRCIITSRITLIDRAKIPLGCTVVRLEDFDRDRIITWQKIWNDYNRDYFEKRNLKPFCIASHTRAWELAKQPLLLLMLALFDSEQNNLRRHENLSLPELYDALIRQFLARESAKDSNSIRKTDAEQNILIENEYRRLCIAALGIFNRANQSLCIQEDELSQDLKVLLNNPMLINSELSDGKRLLGKFFFLQQPTATQEINNTLVRIRSYEFLHKTFYEFLTAHYIVQEIVKILDKFINAKKKGLPFSIMESIEWYASLCYSPLFRESNILDFIQTWFPRYSQKYGWIASDCQTALEGLLKLEIPKVLSGEIWATIDRVSMSFLDEKSYPKLPPIDMAATYSINLVCLASLTMQGRRSHTIQTHEVSHSFGYQSLCAGTLLDIETLEQYSPHAWKKLLLLWRYSFGEDAITEFAKRFVIKTDSLMHRFLQRYHFEDQNLEQIFPENNLPMRKLITHNFLNEEWEYTTLGALLDGNYESILEGLFHFQLDLKARFSLTHYMNNYIAFSYLNSDNAFGEHCLTNDPMTFLSNIRTYAFREKDAVALFGYYLLLSHMVNHQAPKLSLSSLIDFESLLSDFRYIGTVWKGCEPVHVQPIILDILLHHPIFNRSPWNLYQEDFTNYEHNFELFESICDALPTVSCFNIIIQEEIMFYHTVLINRMLLLDSTAQLLSNEYWFADRLKTIVKSVRYILHEYPDTIHSRTILEILRLADNLMQSVLKQEGRNILSIFLQALERERLSKIHPVTIEYAVPLLSALRNYYQRRKSNNVSQWLPWLPDPSLLLLESPQAVLDLCTLGIAYPNEIGYPVLPDLINMVRSYPDRLTLPLYKALVRLSTILDASELSQVLNSFI